LFGAGLSNAQIIGFSWLKDKPLFGSHSDPVNSPRILGRRKPTFGEKIIVLISNNMVKVSLGKFYPYFKSNCLRRNFENTDETMGRLFSVVEMNFFVPGKSTSDCQINRNGKDKK